MSDETEHANALVMHAFIVETIAILSKDKPEPQKAAQEFLERIVEHIDRLERSKPERAKICELARSLLDADSNTLAKHYRSLGDPR